MAIDESLFNDTIEGAPPIPRTSASIAAAETRKMRSSYKYQKLREEFRFQQQHLWMNDKEGAPCWLCGGDIRYELQYPHPQSWSLDHAITVHEKPEFLLDRNNFRSSHLDCNALRGTDDPKLDIGEPSEIW